MHLTQKSTRSFGIEYPAVSSLASLIPSAKGVSIVEVYARSSLPVSAMNPPEEMKTTDHRIRQRASAWVNNIRVLHVVRQTVRSARNDEEDVYMAMSVIGSSSFHGRAGQGFKPKLHFGTTKLIECM
jgi:hypothetical protein